MVGSVVRHELPPEDARTVLRNGLVRALKAVPMHFSSPISIEGVSAVDLFAMNTLLGGAIEEQTVATLNATRAIWDPDGKWADFEFRRYAESFPDVRLECDSHGEPSIGIELIGRIAVRLPKRLSIRRRIHILSLEAHILMSYPMTKAEILDA